MIGSANTLGLELALQEVLDPETGLDVVNMGLIYGLELDAPSGLARVTMTLTSPACPAGGVIREGIERRLRLVPEVHAVEVKLTFDPRWTPDRISEEGKAALGW